LPYIAKRFAMPAEDVQATVSIPRAGAVTNAAPKPTRNATVAATTA
jgi:hypothetical protein